VTKKFKNFSSTFSRTISAVFYHIILNGSGITNNINIAVGTNQIHGQKCMISRQNFLNVSNFTENSRKEFCKFTGPTDIISRCCTIANEEISEQRIFTTLSQNSRQSMSTT